MKTTVDGIIYGSSIFEPQFIPTQVSRQNCKIGRSNFNGEEDAYADFDELKIYNRALSYEEILNDKAYFHH